MRKAVFLDRDGVINIDKSYVYKKEDFEFSKGVFKALKHFRKLGYLLIIVTNQSGIGRCYYTQKDFEKLTEWMLGEFEKKGVKIDGVYFCPHKPEDGCICRKPEPGMIKKAAEDFDIDLKKSWMIGDKERDIEAAHRAGIENTILIGDIDTSAKFKVNSILDTISIIKV
ncbi:D-glycero-beta-D-manno-heptose 1,7-bisphosphate 7-phosphatase [Nitrosophilus alvini]|uniref:D-glycero-beta-D-manno-heptose 1,7-bisphosphate 7-phosphatase n=1 Tax=Nitrosophilus alvini TaxID=2714855 RepID=UPI00190D4443|nr:D-glycero-beta-D-manno-heptose 1,7-bisphosphate 7-phosphatase [Nitrosophilus alvini]